MTIRSRNVRLFASSIRTLAVLLALAVLGVLAGAPQTPLVVWTWSSFAAIGALPEADAPGRQPSARPVSEVGALAAGQYAGDGLAVLPTRGGARLRSAFQKIHGDATRGGLWITSTASGEEGRLRMMASAIGRDTATTPLAGSGRVNVRDGVAAFVRRGVTEEYATSVDGVRQDFVIAASPDGSGRLRLDLALEGATAAQSGPDAALTLEGSGRALLYRGLHVTDANGRELPATLDVVASNRLAVRVDDAGAAYPVRIDPTFTDADWVSLNPGIPGTTTVGSGALNVTALAVDGSGNLYVGGSFTLIGNVAGARIAKWDGSTWSTLGTGLNNTVLALVVSGGDLYAGGTFSTAGGVSASGIARWNGSVWSALGAGVNSNVNALAMIGTDLYAGGTFTSAGGAPANRIAKWNGSAWSALGAGLDNTVNALTVSGTDLYAGGAFTTSGGVVAVSRVAKWSTTTSAWSALGGGTNSSVLALATGGGFVYAGGAFTLAGGVPNTKNIARWNGTAWSAMGTGADHQVLALAVSGSDVYAGGLFGSAGGVTASRVAKWNGSSWSALSTGINGNVGALVVNGGTLVAGGGAFTLAGGVPAVNLAQWNGTAWSAFPPAGLTGLVRAVAVSGTTIYVGGDFFTAGAPNTSFIAQWNGTAWSGLGTGVNQQVLALAVSGGTLYAAGNFSTAGGVAANRIAKWTGGTWSSLSSFTDRVISALLVSSTGDLYAAGDFDNIGGISAHKIAKWSPGTSTWSALGVGLEGSALALAEGTGGAIYVGGNMTKAGGLSTPFIAQWAPSTTTWSGLGTGMNGGVLALAVIGSDLYAGGAFTSAGGAANTLRIAKWTGSAWSSVGSGGMNGAVRALATDGTNLYAGGDFTTAGGVAANRIAKWDGSAWSRLGTGTDDSVFALAADASGALYAGGAFLLAGTTVSPFIVKANPPVNHAPVANAGADQSVVATSPSGATVTLTGSASSDPDGDTLTYTWREGATVVGTGAVVTGTVAIGVHSFTLTVTDPGGLEATDSATVEVRDALSVTSTAPPVAPTATYTFGQVVPASYSCSSAAGTLASCVGTVANGANIDTSTLGSHPFTVTATSTLGETTSVTWTYTVLAAPSIVTVTCPATAIYTGAALTPCTATITGAGGLNLTATPTYANNVNVGLASAVYTYPGDATHTGSGGSNGFNIVPTPVTATMTANSKVYDGTTAEPDASLSCALSGVLPGDSANVVCTPSGGTFDNPNVGSPQVVTATLTLSGSAAGNYTLGAAGTTTSSTSTTAPAAITPKGASVTPEAGTKIYGAADPALTGTLAGFLAADAVTATYSRAAGETVATYAISATLAPVAVLGNYDITYDTSSFAITPAGLTVTANDSSRADTAPNPAFDGTVTGVVPGDGITATYSATSTNVPGTYPIVPTLEDPNGKLGNYYATIINGTLTVTDTQPPLITVPADITAEATSAAGAGVPFDEFVSAFDVGDGPVGVACAPASGETFALGTTTVSCVARDRAGNTGGRTFMVTVQDTTAPSLTVHDVTVTATNPDGAPVDFAAEIAASDLVGVDSLVCTPTSGSLFAIADTTVSCTASDAAGNSTSESFTVHVLDGVPPAITVGVPPPAEATLSSGAAVSFTATVLDNLDEMLTPTCVPASGTIFALGDTPVTCTAEDAAGNTGAASFTVTVIDTTPPTLTVPTLVTGVVLGGTDVAVSYDASAVDVVDGSVIPVCSPVSGSLFPIGDTPVTCTATDDHLNASTATITIRVNDGVAPVVTVAPSGNQSVEATSVAGAVVSFAASATDNTNETLTAACVPAAGSTFPLGTVAVTCSATDAGGNTGRTTFDVTVVDTTPPVLALPAPLAATAYVEAGVAVTFSATALDLVNGSVGVTCAPASGSAFAPGQTTVSCTATDSRGNGSAGSFTVTVTLAENRIGKFVAFSRDSTLIRANAKIVTGDVGANERRQHVHRGENDDTDDGDKDEVTVRVGERAAMQQTTSRVVGDTVRLLNGSSVYHVVDNVLINKRGTILGSVTSPLAIPYLTLPAFPAVTPGTVNKTVAERGTLTLGPGSYGTVRVRSRGTLVLTGGVYQMISLDVDEGATVVFRGATEVRIKTELATNAKAKLILDQSVPGLAASQMVIYVEGSNTACQHNDRDDDGDDNGPAAVHIGQQNVVQANIYAANGTVWLRSKTQATGSFIGEHVRVGQKVTLTIDSAFK